MTELIDQQNEIADEMEKKYSEFKKLIESFELQNEVKKQILDKFYRLLSDWNFSELNHQAALKHISELYSKIEAINPSYWETHYSKKGVTELWIFDSASQVYDKHWVYVDNKLLIGDPETGNYKEIVLPFNKSGKKKSLKEILFEITLIRKYKPYCKYDYHSRLFHEFYEALKKYRFKRKEMRNNKEK